MALTARLQAGDYPRGHRTHSQAAPRSNQAGRQRHSHRGRSAAGISSARPHAEAGNEDAGGGRRGGVDEKHHAGAMSAGVAGGGQHRLWICLWRRGAVSRFGLQAARLHFDGAASDPQRQIDARAVGPARRGGQTGPSPPRSVLGHRPDGIGKKYDVGQLGEPDQRGDGPPHHHDRGPDRVLSRPYPEHDQSARGRGRRPSFSEAIRRALRQDPM